MKQLARWTLTWFAVALGFLTLSLGLAVLGVARPDGWAEGRALAVVHLFALGWLGTMMLGALIQFVPVLAARALVLPGLALPTLLLSATGTLALAAGFLGLEGWMPGLTLLTLAPVLLGAAFALAAAMLAGTLLRARGWRDSAGRSVLAALVALPLVWLSGSGMAEALAGHGIGAALLADGLPWHILLALGGWLGLASFGVSYRLFSMFLLAPEAGGRLRDVTLAGGVAFILLAAGGLGAALAGGLAAPMLPALGVAALAVAGYAADISRVWRTRRRPEVEVNMEMSRVSLAFLALAVLLAAVAALRGGAWAEAAVFTALTGWLSLLTLAQMVKIVSFLTWIQIFAPRIGRGNIPMVQALVDARATRRWLWLWAVGAAGGALALLLRADTGFRLAALLLLIAALGLLAELVAIRRLRHLPPAQRPDRLPPLFLPIRDKETFDVALRSPFRPGHPGA